MCLYSPRPQSTCPETSIWHRFALICSLAPISFDTSPVFLLLALRLPDCLQVPVQLARTVCPMINLFLEMPQNFRIHVLQMYTLWEKFLPCSHIFNSNHEEERQGIYRPRI